MRCIVISKQVVVRGLFHVFLDIKTIKGYHGSRKQVETPLKVLPRKIARNNHARMDGQLEGIPLNSNLKKIRNAVTSVTMGENVFS